MAETLKILGQASSTANQLATLYTVPADTIATISTIVICNQNNTPGTFRLAVAFAGAADDTKQYLYYDQVLEENSTFTVTIGITLGATDLIRVSANLSNFSFNAFGIEVA